MSHMVIYRGADGKPGYHQTDDIHDAVGFVEQMRNEEGVEHARIFRLEEVVFEYRPYYRVELSTAGGTPTMIGASPHPRLPEAEPPSPADRPVPAFDLSGSSAGAGQADEAESIDLVDDVIEVVDHGDDLHRQHQPEVAMAKKGLFGR